jgi:hypothetical protein
MADQTKWFPLAWAFAVACVGIFVRSIFRTVENAQGFHGYLSVHEVYFWTLDALPLVIAIAVFIPYWPGKLLPADSVKDEKVMLDNLDLG